MTTSFDSPEARQERLARYEDILRRMKAKGHWDEDEIIVLEAVLYSLQLKLDEHERGSLCPMSASQHEEGC